MSANDTVLTSEALQTSGVSPWNPGFGGLRAPASGYQIVLG
jgi:hypothetical protein